MKGICNVPKVTEARDRITRFFEQIERSRNGVPGPDARRTSFRYTWPTHATVRFVEPDEPSEPLFVTVSHISEDGLDFRCSRRLPLEQKLLVSMDTDEGEVQIAATVVHSTESVAGFVVGVRFDLRESCQTDDQ